MALARGRARCTGVRGALRVHAPGTPAPFEFESFEGRLKQ
jgi:hypothetical protein